MKKAIVLAGRGRVNRVRTVCEFLGYVTWRRVCSGLTCLGKNVGPVGVGVGVKEGVFFFYFSSISKANPTRHDVGRAGVGIEDLWSGVRRVCVRRV